MNVSYAGTLNITNVKQQEQDHQMWPSSIGKRTNSPDWMKSMQRSYKNINNSHSSKHFRPKLVNSNESVYCTPIDRALGIWFNEGLGSFLRPTIPELWTMLWVFVKSIVLFFGQNKYINIRRFSTMFRHKTRIFNLQKVQKIQFWVKWLHNIYLAKAKSRTLSLFIENAQI